jgi:hypothetical protein
MPQTHIQCVLRASAGIKTKGAPAASVASDDRLYAFEAVGQLLGTEDLPAEEQREAVNALLRPLIQQMDGQLLVASKAPAGAPAWNSCWRHGSLRSTTSKQDVLCFDAFKEGSLWTFAPCAGSGERKAAEVLVQQALEAVSRASKGFSLQLCTQTRPQIGDLLAAPLQAAIHILQVLEERHQCTQPPK